MSSRPVVARWLRRVAIPGLDDRLGVLAFGKEFDGLLEKVAHDAVDEP